VARKLDPRLNMWATAEPVVGAWIADNLGPRGKIEDLGRGVAQLARLVADAPQKLETIANLIERFEHTASDAAPFENHPQKQRSVAAGASAAALWAIVALLLWIALRR
jgi:ubiquinone biosynthesis protein